MRFVLVSFVSVRELNELLVQLCALNAQTNDEVFVDLNQRHHIKLSALARMG